MRRRTFILALGLFALPAIACGNATPTPKAGGNSAAPTQTRAAELSQIATLSAPTKVPAPSASSAGLFASAAPSVAPTAAKAPDTAPTSAPKIANTPAPAKPSSAPPSSGTTHGLNELVSVKNWDMAVARVERPGTDLVWSEFGNKSGAAGTWVVIAFDMKNTAKQNFGVNTFDFQLKAAGGVTYAYTDDFGAYSYADYKKGQTIGGQVPPGVTVHYYLIFDVAPDATDLQLVFKQDTNPTFAIGDAAQ